MFGRIYTLNSTKWLGAMLFGGALAGCNMVDEPGNTDPVQTCGHNYQEPVLTINYANDEQTGQDVESIVLRNITINGRPLIDASNTLISSRNVLVKDGTVVCTLPCAFGTEEGSYRFYVDKPGYAAQYVAVDANYRVYSGGCPSYSDQGLHIGITITRP